MSEAGGAINAQYVVGSVVESAGGAAVEPPEGEVRQLR